MIALYLIAGFIAGLAFGYCLALDVIHSEIHKGNKMKFHMHSRTYYISKIVEDKFS